MSDTLYPINYNDAGFFSSDQNVIATFPFPLESAIQWAQHAPNKPLSSADASKITSLFDSPLSAVITNPGNERDFVDNFLKKNMYLNDNFSQISVSTATDAPSNKFTPSSVTINGSVYGGTRVTGTNGSTSYLLGTPGYQRVIYQPVCTINHLHYPNGCNVQQVINDTNGSSYYKCVCTGTPAFNSNAHSHCSEFTSKDTDPSTAITNAYSNKGGMNSSTAGQTGTAGSSSSSLGSSTNFTVDYANKDNLTQTDALVRQAVYMYYCEVNKNITYKADMKHNKEKSLTATQALADSTVKYKNQYLTAFNLLSGIIIAGGYVYSLI